MWPKRHEFNVVVIGAGAGGLVASYLASALKAKVALIEKHRMGGDCLHTGCVPSKALLKTAKILSLEARASEFGLDKISIEKDFLRIMARIKNVIEKIEPNDSVERYTGLGVTCFQGAAKILSPHAVQVGDKVLTTKSIILATGARPVVPPIPGINEIEPFTSDTIWDLKELPRRLLILGGGVIGCEMAQAFQRLGSQVTLLERNERVLKAEDAEVGECVLKKFRAEGMDVRIKTEAKSFRKQGNEKFISLESPAGKEELAFDAVLLALGRKANTSGFGLEEQGIKIKNGSIESNLLQQTNIPNIFVCGDASGPFNFTHFASLSGTTAILNALFPLRLKTNTAVFPWAIYTDPEIARVGLSEDDAKKSNIAYEKTIFFMNHSDRALTESETEGFVKVLTVPGKDKILGATIVGASAGELIMEFTLAMKFRLGLKKIMGTVHPYPTLMEANRMAAGAWSRNHAPAWIYPYLDKFHRFRRWSGI